MLGWVSLCVLVAFGTTNGADSPTPVDKCTNADGHVYGIGEFYNPDSCTYCMCKKEGEKCNKPCYKPPCLNPEQDPGECCPHCPSGPDCLGHDGVLIASGSSKTYTQGHYCECPLPTEDEIGHHHIRPRKPECHRHNTIPPFEVPRNP